MKKTLVILAIIPFITLAQANVLSVGDQGVTYDDAIEKEVGTLYYQGDVLVASEHDGVTLVYENEQVVLEAHDTNSDGVLDAFFTLNENDEVVEVTGENAAAFQRPEPVEFSTRLESDTDSSEEDLVGSLDSITIPGQGLPVVRILLVLALIGVGYWLYRKKKQFEAD